MRQCYRILILLTALSYLNIYPQETVSGGNNPGTGYSNGSGQNGVTSSEITAKEVYPPNSRGMIPALNFKDTDLRDILRSIAFEYQTNIVVDNSINGRASAALFNVSVMNAIEMIARDNGYDFSYDSLRFYVKPQKVKLPPPIPEADPEVLFNHGKLSLKLINADINKLVEKLRDATGKNFLLSQGTSGRITGELKNVGLETGLKNILQNNGFFLTTTDSIFYIARSSYFSSLEGSNAPSKSTGYWVNARNNRVTLDVMQANLDQVLTDIARQMGLQIIKLAIPSGSVTVRCTDVPLGTAMGYLFKGTEFSFREENGAYIIGPKASKGLDNTRLLRLKYLRADKIKETLPQTFTQGMSVGVSLEHNALIASGSNEAVANLEDYLQAIDRPVPQVLIEALVVDYNLDNMLQYGITAGRGDSLISSRPSKYYPGVDVTLSGSKVNKLLNSIGTINLFGKDLDVAKLGKLPDDFYMNLKLMEQHGIANVKSKPLLSSLNGHTASLKIGTVQNYVFNEIMPITSQVNSTFIERERIEKIEANISFEITPWVGPNSELTLEIKPEFQTPVGPFVPDKRLIPAINTRSMFSTVRLKDGETIILGGLIQESETNTEDKVPLLGDIPFIGKFFTNVDKKKSKGELIIYLTPRISYGDDFGNSYYEYSK